jgi:UDP-N-acetylmuramyl pentapeptide synthase
VNAALTPDVTLLVKGSRSNRLERVVASLGAGTGEMH